MLVRRGHFIYTGFRKYFRQSASLVRLPGRQRKIHPPDTEAQSLYNADGILKIKRADIGRAAKSGFIIQPYFTIRRQ
jgi:hypothetical protein